MPVHTLAALQLLFQSRQETLDEFVLGGFPGFFGVNGFLRRRMSQDLSVADNREYLNPSTLYIYCLTDDCGGLSIKNPECFSIMPFKAVFLCLQR